jgi:hypothetical protein
MVITHDHTHHTTLGNKHTHKLLVGLATEVIIEVGYDDTIDAIASKEQGTLLDSGKKLHTLGTPHSYAGMWLEGDNNTLGRQALRHSHNTLKQSSMPRVNTIERAHGDNRTHIVRE